MNNHNGGLQQSVNVPVPDVLRTTSDEVRMLAGSAADLQNLIGNLVVAGAFGGSQSIYELQNLDRLCQNLDAIADFLNGLSESALPAWKVDVASAAKTIKLADVAQRLTGQTAGSQNATGDFDDFDSWPMPR
ncbi:MULTISPECIES: hypothetical protein [unclassified Hyphomicrobium]|uniref:hypothetical protein n=1 Tax=unclassified Hyphomicrobium TaxID=2619925 RepID=UPI000213D8C6|nr:MULTISPECIES: hypothetical protein [unclassified Hyphomicrobium]CCB67513.1 conserved protein of unknown function [Hyphomicrobium sp. MC1]